MSCAWDLLLSKHPSVSFHLASHAWLRWSLICVIITDFWLHLTRILIWSHYVCVVVLILPPASNRRSLRRERCDDTSTSLLLWTEGVCYSAGGFDCAMATCVFCLCPRTNQEWISKSPDSSYYLVTSTSVHDPSLVFPHPGCVPAFFENHSPCVYLNSLFSFSFFSRLHWRSMREAWWFCVWCEVTQTLLLAQSGYVICILSHACLKCVLRDTAQVQRIRKSSESLCLEQRAGLVKAPIISAIDSWTPCYSVALEVKMCAGDCRP